MKFLFILCASIGIAIVAEAEIQIADSLEPIEQELKNCSLDTLVFFGITDILVSSNEPLMLHGNEAFRRDWFIQNYPEMSVEERTRLVAILLTDKRLWCLVDNRWPEVIKNAQKRGIKIAGTVKVMADSALQGLIAEVLDSLGLRFKNEFSELASEKLFNYSNGIIETEVPLMGYVVKNVLASLSKRPQLIIFVNDSRAQVQSVEDVCREMFIPYLGFHWTGYLKPTAFDEDVADLQLRTLVKESKWLSTEEARHLLY